VSGSSESISAASDATHRVPPPVISPVSDPRFIGALPEHAVRRMVAAARAAVPRP
jgi:hypothetical protein